MLMKLAFQKQRPHMMSVVWRYANMQGSMTTHWMRAHAYQLMMGERSALKLLRRVFRIEERSSDGRALARVDAAGEEVEGRDGSERAGKDSIVGEATDGVSVSQERLGKNPAGEAVPGLESTLGGAGAESGSGHTEEHVAGGEIKGEEAIPAHCSDKAPFGRVVGDDPTTEPAVGEASKAQPQDQASGKQAQAGLMEATGDESSSSGATSENLAPKQPPDNKIGHEPNAPHHTNTSLPSDYQDFINSLLLGSPQTRKEIRQCLYKPGSPAPSPDDHAQALTDMIEFYRLKDDSFFPARPLHELLVLAREADKQLPQAAAAGRLDLLGPVKIVGGREFGSSEASRRRRLGREGVKGAGRG